MKITVHKKKDSDKPTLYLPRHTFLTLKLKRSTSYYLHVGQRHSKVSVKEQPKAENQLSVSEFLFEEMMLREKRKYHIWVQKNHIHIGPVIGVFVNNQFISQIKNGRPPLRVVKQAESNRVAHTYLFYFSIDDIDWVNEKIRAQVYVNEKDQWLEEWAPFPTVIYDRGVRFKKREKKRVKNIRRTFRNHYGIPRINTVDTLDKWKVYERLSAYPELQGYIPETVPYKGMRDIKEMLDRYGFVYFRIELLAKAGITLQVPLYFFSVHDVYEKSSVVMGTCYHPESVTWEKKRFPFPDILYDRGGGFSPAQRIRAKEIRKQFASRRIPTLNAIHYFNKWRVYQALNKVTELQAHLPETVRCASVHDLESFMQKREEAYIKGLLGNGGKQVIFLKKKRDSSYELRFFVKELVRKTVPSLEEVYHFLFQYFDEQPFIVQQVIPLIKIDDRLVDFRAEVQRNGKGDLEVVAFPARIGAKQSPITTHSQAYSFETFFRTFFNEQEEEIVQKKADVEDFLRRIYTNVEAHFGTFAEIGIDFGMDDKGHLWFIECNAKSAKVSLNMACADEIVERSFLNPVRYAIYMYTNTMTFPLIEGAEEGKGEDDLLGLYRDESWSVPAEDEEEEGEDVNV